MRKIMGLCLLFLLLVSRSYAQRDLIISTVDVDHFWQAYDLVNKTTDSNFQLHLIDSIYIDRGSLGLQALIKERSFTDKSWLKTINKYPKFLRSVRPRTFISVQDKAEITGAFQSFKELYPRFVYPEVYFTIGCISTGGTTGEGRILIGTEIMLADSTTDASEFVPAFREICKIKKRPVYIVTHEAVHTQQNNDPDMDLLGACLREGICDFIAELVLKIEVDMPYMHYGKKHGRELWTQFEKDMYTQAPDWLYNAMTVKNKPADLGYFVGYIIAKSYYQNSADKKKAICTLIEIDYSKKQHREILDACRKKVLDNLKTGEIGTHE